jgi:DNA repair protein RadC
MSQGADYTPTIKDLPSSERPRERLARLGPGALLDSELLAIILRVGTGKENVIRMAERLLGRFGGLSGLARASIAELSSIKGIGMAKAVQLKAAFELGRRLLVEPPDERPQVLSPAAAAQLLMGEMGPLRQEHLRVILLDTRNRVVGMETVYVGGLNSAVVRPAEVFREAVTCNCAAIIVAHNHPSGDPEPSADDVAVTRQIVAAGRLLGVEVLDHLVIGHQRFVSLKERGLGFDQD